MFRYFRDPIHGLIPVLEKEVELIQTPAFQRLRYIRQLGNTYLVYHGAEHTRFGHSIGVMHLISRAIESLSTKEPLKDFKENNLSEFNRMVQTARLAALLHDIGHAPFSHVGENKEFGLFPELKDLDGTNKTGHEVYSRLIISEILGKKIEELFPEIKVADILNLLMGTPENAHQHFVCDLIDGQLDVDKMDYLLRDSHYCGVKYGFYDLDRLMDVICICPSRFDEWQLGVESNGVYVVEEMIFARYWMFIQVYFHKTRRIYDYYMSHFLKSEYKEYPKVLEKYITYTDAKVLEDIKYSKGRNEWGDFLFNRKHMKEIYVSGAQQENDDELEVIARLIDDFKEKYKEEISQHLCYVDQADTSSAKSLIDIRSYKNEYDMDSLEEKSDASERTLPAIPVKDKYSHTISPIQDYSLPIRNMSDKKINLFRIYATESKKDEFMEYINYRKQAIPSEIELDKQRERKISEEIKLLQWQENAMKKTKEERLDRYRK